MMHDGEDGMIRIGMDLQETYDHAVAMSDAFRALAERLAAEADVCTHPEGERARGTAEGAPSYCRACGRIFGHVPRSEEAGR